MPRIRTIKPEHSLNPKVGRLSDTAYRLWVNLIAQADDEGRRRWDAGEFRVLVWAYQPQVTTETVIGAIDELSTSGLVQIYGPSGAEFYQLHDWTDHQRIAHPAPSKIPSPRTFVNLLECSTGIGSRIKDQGSDQGAGSVAELSGVPAPPSLPGNLAGWLLETTHLQGLAEPRHRELWAALERAYDQYSWLYFEDEIRKADVWITANPDRKPTPRGLPRFIRNWFDRAVEYGRKQRHAEGTNRTAPQRRVGAA